MNLPYLKKWCSKFLTMALIVAAMHTVSSHVHAQSKVAVNFENHSEDSALVKLVGLITSATEIAPKQFGTIHATAGKYTLLVRFGSAPEHYSFVRCDSIKKSIRLWPVLTQRQRSNVCRN